MFDCTATIYIISQPAWLERERVERPEGRLYAPSEVEGGEDGRRLWPSSQFQLASIPLKKIDYTQSHMSRKKIKNDKRNLPSESFSFHWVKMNSYCCLKWQRQDMSANFDLAEWFGIWDSGGPWYVSHRKKTLVIWPFLQKMSHLDLVGSTSVAKAKKGPSSKIDMEVEIHLEMLAWHWRASWYAGNPLQMVYLERRPNLKRRSEESSGLSSLNLSLDTVRNPSPSCKRAPILI